MRRFFLKCCIFTGMLLVLPLLGIVLAGLPLGRYFEFPPQTRYVIHASFSCVAFICYGIVILAVVSPLSIRAMRARNKGGERSHGACPFPWWGRLGIVTGLVAWILAWTRFDWFSLFQPHTFVPLWLSFIVVINAIAYRKKAHCMMLDRPGFFLLLFPISATFWWFFEYLNRFVQNWCYSGVYFGSWEYCFYASLSFSTVLPAVLGVRELILASSWFDKAFKDFMPLGFSRTKSLAWAVLLISGAGLGLIGVWPDYFFALLWVSPLLIIISLQALMGESHVFAGIARGDWRLVVSSALAALSCGFFWEMWNYYSLSKWEYAIPFVHRYRIFEMPILGYAGYLPFGLEIAVIGKMLESIFQWWRKAPIN